MGEDALTADTAFGDAFHSPAPRVWSGSGRALGAGQARDVKGAVDTASATAYQAHQPDRYVVAADLDGVRYCERRRQALGYVGRGQVSSDVSRATRGDGCIVDITGLQWAAEQYARGV